MQVYDWEKVAKEQLSPTLGRQVIHTETMTVARVFLSKGGVVPEHSHHNEQISMLDRGALKFVIGGQERIVRPGEVVSIPPHVPHSVEALEDSAAMDLFSPARDDWKNGDDAYLRK